MTIFPEVGDDGEFRPRCLRLGTLLDKSEGHVLAGDPPGGPANKINSHLEDCGVTMRAAVGAAVGLAATEAVNLLTRRQWRAEGVWPLLLNEIMPASVHAGWHDHWRDRFLAREMLAARYSDRLPVFAAGRGFRPGTAVSD